MKCSSVMILVVSFFFTGCAALFHMAPTIEEETFAQTGQYQKCIDSILGPKGTLSSPQNAERIMAENIQTINSCSSSLYLELSRYLFDLRYLTLSLIELGKFDMAKQYIGHGVNNCGRLLDAFENNHCSDNQTMNSFVYRTEIYLLLSYGYIAWFETGKQEKADDFFSPLDNMFMNLKGFKEGNKYHLKYDKSKPIINNIAEAGADLAVMPIEFAFDKLKDFLSDSDELFWGKIFLERAYFYHKMYGDHEKALAYLDKAIDIGKEMSFFYIDAKYVSYMEAYKKKVMIYIQLGNLKEAEKVLDEYNSLAGSILFKLGTSTFGSFDKFKGYIASFYATGGALYALLRDFDKSKEYFDKAADLIKSLDKNTLDENNRYGLANYCL